MFMETNGEVVSMYNIIVYLKNSKYLIGLKLDKIKYYLKLAHCFDRSDNPDVCFVFMDG